MLFTCLWTLNAHWLHFYQLILVFKFKQINLAIPLGKAVGVLGTFPQDQIILYSVIKVTLTTCVSV